MLLTKQIPLHAELEDKLMKIHQNLSGKLSYHVKQKQSLIIISLIRFLITNVGSCWWQLYTLLGVLKPIMDVKV